MRWQHPGHERAPIVTVLMWEARAAAGRLEELLDYVLGHADPAAQVYRSGSAGESRVVVIDPTCRGIPDLPDGLAARAPHSWDFEPVPRDTPR
jgi:hypothetical protein